MEWMKGIRIKSRGETKAVISNDGRLVQFALASNEEHQDNGTVIVPPHDITLVRQNNDQFARDESVITLFGDVFVVLATPRQIVEAIERASYELRQSE